MFGSATPVAVHPVHRANAVMRAALLSSTSPATSSERQNVESLSQAIETVMQGSVSISFPRSLAERLDALDIEDAYPSLGLALQSADSQRRLGVRNGLSASDALSPEVHGLTPAELEAGWDDAYDMLNADEAEALEAASLARVPQVIPQIHVQALLHEFHRRQRRASLLVAGSIATAILLTVGGLLIIAQLAATRAIDGDSRPIIRSTSVTWQKPADAGDGSGLEFAVVSANRATKGEPLLMPKFAEPSAPAAPAQVIMAASGREVALAPLLPSSHAGYLMIRGLPATAKLSAGRQSDSGSGTWLVKGDAASGLTLTMGAAAPGDYPIEVYVLQSGDGPQARRSLVLRVEAPTQSFTYATFAPDMGWASALFDVVPAAQAAEQPAVPAEAKVLHDRAQRLLQEGDIASARLLLLHLAERGEGDAAYDLARTFDRDMLAELGAKGIGGDATRARDWYQRAAADGNAKATERLKILASLSGTDPSD